MPLPRTCLDDCRLLPLSMRYMMILFAGPPMILPPKPHASAKRHALAPPSFCHSKMHAFGAAARRGDDDIIDATIKMQNNTELKYYLNFRSTAATSHNAVILPGKYNTVMAEEKFMCQCISFSSTLTNTPIICASDVLYRKFPHA